MKRKVLNVLIIILFIAALVCNYFVYDYFYKNDEEENQYDEIRAELSGDYKSRQDDYLGFETENEDTVGWIHIDDTKIDYPVMQTPDDEEYYLRRDFNKKDSMAGSIFAAAASDVDKPSQNIILYGHMMKAGNMFGDLKQYLEESFYNNHRYITFDTLEESRVYKIAYVFTTAVGPEAEDEIKYYTFIDPTEDEFNTFISEVEDAQLYDAFVDVEYGDELLTLSTCEYSQDNGRLVIIGKRIELEDESAAEEYIAEAASDNKEITLGGGNMPLLLSKTIFLLILILFAAFVINEFRRRKK